MGGESDSQSCHTPSHGGVPEERWCGDLVPKSRATLATPWTVARQAPLSLGFSRPEYWSGLPFPSPADLPDPGIEPGSPALQADSSPTELRGKPLSYEGSLEVGWLDYYLFPQV